MTQGDTAKAVNSVGENPGREEPYEREVNLRKELLIVFEAVNKTLEASSQIKLGCSTYYLSSNAMKG